MVVQVRIAMDRTKPFFIYWFLFPFIRMQQIIAHSAPCRHIKLFDACRTYIHLAFFHSKYGLYLCKIPISLCALFSKV